MPTRKKKSQAKRAGELSKGGTPRPAKTEGGLTSSDHHPPSGELGRLEGEVVFYDAADDLTEVGDRAAALSPSVGGTESTGHESRSRVAGIGRDPPKRTPYYPRYYSHPTRYSVGVQTVSTGKSGDGLRTPIIETLQWGVIDPEEMEGPRRESFSCDDGEFEDALETVAEGALPRQGRSRQGMLSRSRVNFRDRRDKMVQVSCPEETRRETGDRGCRVNGTGLRQRHPRQGDTGNSAETAEQDSHNPTCCSCLLTLLFWLAVVLLLSFLLSLCLAVFLLFSRNYGLGIGPGLLYSDAEHIRNQVDPYLDLRHKGPPPT